MTTRTSTTKNKTVRHSDSVLGRSLATGRFVLKPASKAGSITVRDAKAAASSLHSSLKK